jgi:hypothetical protein
MSTNFHVGSKSRDVIDDSPERTVSKRLSTTNEEEPKLPAKAYAFEAKTKTLSSSTVRSAPQLLPKQTSNIDRISQLQQSSGDYHKIRKAFPSFRPSFRPQNALQPQRLLTGVGMRPANSLLRIDQSIHESKQHKQNREYSNKNIDNSDTITKINQHRILSNVEHASNYQGMKSLISKDKTVSSSIPSASCLAGKSNDYETDRLNVSDNNFLVNQQSNNLRSDTPQLTAITASTAAAAAATAAAAAATATATAAAVVKKDVLLGINASVQSAGPQYQRESLQNIRHVEEYSQISARYQNVQTGTGNTSRLDSSGKTVDCDGPRSEHRYQNVGTLHVPTPYMSQEVSKAIPVVNNDNFVRNSSKNKGGTCKAGRPKSALAAKMKRRRDIGDRREQSMYDDRKMAGTYGSVPHSNGQREDQVGASD